MRKNLFTEESRDLADDRQKKKYDYLVGDTDFFAGGFMRLRIEMLKYEKFGVKTVHSIAGKPGQDKDSWFGYKVAAGDSISAMLDRIILW
jgi:hypothetical protein